MKLYGVLFKNHITDRGLALYKDKKIAEKQLKSRKINDNLLKFVLFHVINDDIKNGYVKNVLISDKNGKEKRIDYKILNSNNILNI